MTPASRLMIEELTRLAAKGLGYREVAWALGTTPNYVCKLAKKHGIAFKLERRGPKPRDEGRVAA